MSALSVMAIVPCFNEEGRIGGLLTDLIPRVDRVCVINDGSSDGTLEEIDGFDVKVISYEKNHGKGFAIKQGIRYFLNSDCDIAIFIDGDGQHDPKDIRQFVSMFKAPSKPDVVVGSRFGTQQWIYNMPLLRKISNLLSRFGLWVLYNGLEIEDPQNGYRAYSKRVLEVIEFNTQRYEAETEIIIDAYLKGFSFEVVHVESKYLEENHSKFSLLMDTWSIPGIMLKGFFRLKPFLYRREEDKLAFRDMALRRLGKQ